MGFIALLDVDVTLTNLGRTSCKEYPQTQEDPLLADIWDCVFYHNFKCLCEIMTDGSSNWPIDPKQTDMTVDKEVTFSRVMIPLT